MLTDRNVGSRYHNYQMLHALATRPEYELLVRMSRPDLAERDLQIMACSFQSRFSWELFTQLALRHEVAPIVYKNLRAFCEEAVPSDILSFLRSQFRDNAQTNLVLAARLHELIDFFRRHDIVALPFKGITIPAWLGADPGSRKCGDIDLLVREADFSRAKTLLLEQGYVPTLSLKTESQCLQSGLWHEGRRIKVDLHWGVPPRILSFDTSRLWEDLAQISITGRAVSTLSAEHTLLILCINATKEYWAQSLYRYSDIAAFIESGKIHDWAELWGQAAALGCTRMTRVALWLTHHLFTASLPGELALQIQLTRGENRVAREILDQMFPLSDPGREAQPNDLIHFLSYQHYYIPLAERMSDRFWLVGKIIKNSLLSGFAHAKIRIARIFEM